MSSPTYFIEAALEQARKALDHEEVPVGAVVVHHGKIIAAAHNNVISHKDPTAHAEVLALREAAKALGSEFLNDCDLYVTLEPCPMCAGAIAHSRIRQVVFGAYDPKGGGVDHGPRVFAHALHKPEVIGGVQEAACAHILKDFFVNRRGNT
jgi:tRNA(adenine34) deaminase